MFWEHRPTRWQPSRSHGKGPAKRRGACLPVHLRDFMEELPRTRRISVPQLRLNRQHHGGILTLMRDDTFELVDSLLKEGPPVVGQAIVGTGHSGAN